MNAVVQEIKIQQKTEIQIVEYSQTAAALSLLRGKYHGVLFAVATPPGMRQAREARAEIKGYRVDLEKLRQELKAPALERCRLIDEEAKRITAALVTLENPIDDQIKAEETRKENERQAKEEAERARVAKIRDWIGKLQSAPALNVNKPSTEIRAAIEQVKAYELKLTDFMEFFAEATAAKAEAIHALEALATDTEAKEAEARKLAAEREELARLRAESEARMKAVREAHEAKLRAERQEAERIEAEKRREHEAEKRRLAAERTSLEHQRRDLERAEASAKAEGERVEAEQVRVEREAAERAAREAEERKAAEQIERLLSDIEHRWNFGEISATEALMEAYQLGQLSRTTR